MPGGLGAAYWQTDLRRPRRSESAQPAHNRRSGCADWLGWGACWCPRPRPCSARQRGCAGTGRLRNCNTSVRCLGSCCLLGRWLRN